MGCWLPFEIIRFIKELLLSKLICICGEFAVLYVFSHVGFLIAFHGRTGVAAHRSHLRSSGHELGHLFVVDERNSDQVSLCIDGPRLGQSVSGVLDDSLEQGFVYLPPIIEFRRHERHHIFVPVPQVLGQDVVVGHLNFLVVQVVVSDSGCSGCAREDVASLPYASAIPVCAGSLASCLIPAQGILKVVPRACCRRGLLRGRPNS